MWRIVRAAAACAALAASCSDSGGGTAGGTSCAARSGSYLVSYVETSGTCGPISQQTTEIPKPAGADCTGVVAEATPDNCQTTTGATCPAPSLGTGFTTESTLDVTWAPDGNAGSGTYQATVRDGSGSVFCDSTYTVTIARP